MGSGAWVYSNSTGGSGEDIWFIVHVGQVAAGVGVDRGSWQLAHDLMRLDPEGEDGGFGLLLRELEPLRGLVGEFSYDQVYEMSGASAAMKEVFWLAFYWFEVRGCGLSDTVGGVGGEFTVGDENFGMVRDGVLGWRTIGAL